MSRCGLKTFRLEQVFGKDVNGFVYIKPFMDMCIKCNKRLECKNIPIMEQIKVHVLVLVDRRDKT